jgi:tetratricopeptide (TPR) repeat protein
MSLGLSRECRMPLWKRRTCLAVVAVIVSAGMAFAQSAQRWDWCNGKNDASPDLIVSGCTAVIQSGREDAEDLAIAFYNRGTAFRIKSEFDRAIADYDQSIKLNPKAYDPYVDRGWAYHLKGDFDRAIENYSEAIKLDSENERAFIMRGAAWQRKGDYDRAIHDNDEAIRINPKNANAYMTRGNDYREKLDYERALQDYNSALDLEPDDGVLFANRCYVHALAGHHELALKDCNESIRLRPADNWYALGRRGFAYLLMLQHEKAIADFDAALKINPNNSVVLFARGLAKSRMGHQAAGEADFARAKRMQSNVAELLARHGVK